MASATQNNKPRNCNHQRLNSHSPMTTSTNTIRNFRVQQDNRLAREKVVQDEKLTETKRGRTRVELNGTLRRIRHLIVEGRTNLEIQTIPELNERTFYRYMAKIYKTDQALFEEQERKSLATEIGLFRDRLLKAYQWFMSMAENEKRNPSIRMSAMRTGLGVAWALIILKMEGPLIIEKEGIL